MPLACRCWHRDRSAGDGHHVDEDVARQRGPSQQHDRDRVPPPFRAMTVPASVGRGANPDSCYGRRRLLTGHQRNRNLAVDSQHRLLTKMHTAAGRRSPPPPAPCSATPPSPGRSPGSAGPPPGKDGGSQPSSPRPAPSSSLARLEPGSNEEGQFSGSDTGSVFTCRRHAVSSGASTYQPVSISAVPGSDADFSACFSHRDSPSYIARQVAACRAPSPDRGTMIAARIRNASRRRRKPMTPPPPSYSRQRPCGTPRASRPGPWISPLLQP